MEEFAVQFLFYALFALIIAGADQVSKFYIVEHIPLRGSVEWIPGIIRLTHVQNTGAAFSALEGARWLFVAVFLLLGLALVWEYFKKRLPFTTFERWCMAAVFGGGLGNAIDRARLGHVVDMIETQFMTFPVFNVADCFITCGCIALMVSLAFFNKNFWKE